MKKKTSQPWINEKLANEQRKELGYPSIGSGWASTKYPKLRKVNVIFDKNNVVHVKFAKPIKKVKTKKKLPKEKKTSLAKLKKQADILAGALCRSRGSCEAVGQGIACGGPLQWCHIISRKYHNVRWLPQNCIALCRNHHAKYTYNPDDWIAFLMNYYKETYIWLYDKKNIFVKIDRSFMENTIKNLSN